MSVALDLTLAAWAALELAVRAGEAVRGKGRTGRDRGTRFVVALALGACVALAASRPLAAWPGSAAGAAGGLLAMWLGLGLRAGAVAALGGSFRTTVEVDAGQAVVARGPYRLVRHPSYTGLLLLACGYGVARGAWLALGACALLLVPALVRRIRVEEAELDRALGDAYRAYRRSTPARLLPRLW